MPIATINPATAETLKTFDALTDAQIDARSRRRRGRFRPIGVRRSPSAPRRMHRAAEILDRSRGAFGRDDDDRDGQARQGGSEEAAKCAWALPLLRRERRADARRRAGAEPRRPRASCRLPAARADPRRDAVELSLLAGVPLRRARADGRQRRAAQARLQRAAVRAGDRGRCSGAPAFRRARFRRC